ncbi:Uncharacterised protein [Salmonella bongori]|nr:Uncharacterised protein [Salmonella bongori]
MVACENRSASKIAKTVKIIGTIFRVWNFLYLNNIFILFVFEMIMRKLIMLYDMRVIVFPAKYSYR